MIIFTNTKRNAGFVLVSIFFCLATLPGCKKKRPEMAAILFKRTHNKVFKDIKPDEFTAVFKRELTREREVMSNPQMIRAHYEENDYEPDFVLYQLWSGGIDAMLAKYQKANEHGLDPKLFQADEIKALMAKFTTKDAIKTPKEA